MSTDISLHHYVSTNSLVIKPVRSNKDNMQASQYTLSLSVSLHRTFLQPIFQMQETRHTKTSVTNSTNYSVFTKSSFDKV